MTLLADKDERFKYLFGKTAVFILLAAIGMGLAFVWTGVKKGAFSAKSPIYFVADSGQDLSVGMPVKFSGFKIGKLNSLELDGQGQVQVEVNIESKYLGLMRQDSVMTLKKEGVIGDGILELSRGTENKPALAAGGTVKFERANGLEQAVVDIKNRITPILDDVHQLLHDPHGDLRLTLTNLREFTSGMNGTRERIDHVLDNEVGPLLRSIKVSAANAESMTAKIDQELPALLNKADSSMESLRLTGEAIKNAVQQTVPQVPGMMGDARETMGKTREVIGDTQEVLESLSTHWPLKNAVPAPETGPVRMDSHD